MPADFSLPTASRKPLQVVGGVAIPACLNSALLYQKPIMPMSNGMPYSRSSSRYGFFAAASRPSDHGFVRSVRSSTSPASTCCFRTPPPHVWKMSGSFPEAVSAVIFDL